jgi:hypothetical protein
MMQTTARSSEQGIRPVRADHFLPMTCPSARCVMCAHCGAPIFLEVTLPGAIWCRTCLHEAPYRMEDVTEL